MTRTCSCCKRELSEHQFRKVAREKFDTQCKVCRRDTDRGKYEQPTPQEIVIERVRLNNLAALWFYPPSGNPLRCVA